MRSALVLALVCVMGSLVLAQDRPQEPAAAKRNRPDYVIGPGDLLSMTVFGIDQLSQAARVSNSGKVHLTRVGIMKVAGKTAQNVEAEVSAKLRAGGLVVEPWVQIKVVEYRAHPVYILGEVMTPGQFVMRNEMYLQDLLTLGQGFNTNASRFCYLYRREPRKRTGGDAAGESRPSDPEEMVTQEAIKVDPEELNRNPELNLALRAGDILYCPEKRKQYFFIIGDVLRPGLYEIPDGVSVAFSRAMALAGGPTRTAKSSKCILVRYDEGGVRQEVKLDFGAVMKGMQPDMSVRLNDVVYVPGSGAKTIGAALLGIVPSIVTGNAAAGAR